MKVFKISLILIAIFAVFSPFTGEFEIKILILFILGIFLFMVLSSWAIRWYQHKKTLQNMEGKSTKGKYLDPEGSQIKH